MSKIVRRVTYEWDVETYDAHGDILDHDFSERCPGIPDDPLASLVLVRNEWLGLSADFNMSADLDHRAWAYVDERGRLPATFDDGSKVPRRYHRALAAWTGNEEEVT